jgi:hypothetical protein
MNDAVDRIIDVIDSLVPTDSLDRVRSIMDMIMAVEEPESISTFRKIVEELLRKLFTFNYIDDLVETEIYQFILFVMQRGFFEEVRRKQQESVVLTYAAHVIRTLTERYDFVLTTAVFKELVQALLQANSKMDTNELIYVHKTWGQIFNTEVDIQEAASFFDQKMREFADEKDWKNFIMVALLSEKTRDPEYQFPFSCVLLLARELDLHGESHECFRREYLIRMVSMNFEFVGYDDIVNASLEIIRTTKHVPVITRALQFIHKLLYSIRNISNNTLESMRETLHHLCQDPVRGMHPETLTYLVRIFKYFEVENYNQIVTTSINVFVQRLQNYSDEQYESLYTLAASIFTCCSYDALEDPKYIVNLLRLTMTALDINSAFFTSLCEDPDIEFLTGIRHFLKNCYTSDIDTNAMKEKGLLKWLVDLFTNIAQMTAMNLETLKMFHRMLGDVIEAGLFPALAHEAVANHNISEEDLIFTAIMDFLSKRTDRRDRTLSLLIKHVILENPAYFTRYEDECLKLHLDRAYEACVHDISELKESSTLLILRLYLLSPEVAGDYAFQVLGVVETRLLEIDDVFYALCAAIDDAFTKRESAIRLYADTLLEALTAEFYNAPFGQEAMLKRVLMQLRIIFSQDLQV